MRVQTQLGLDGIKIHALAAALQYRLLELRRQDGENPEKHFYAIDPNVINLVLDPKDRAISGKGQLLGAGDVYPDDGTESRHFAAAPITASIGRYIFQDLSSKSPLVILDAYAHDCAGLVTSVTEKAQERLSKTAQASRRKYKTGLIETLQKSSDSDELFDTVNKLLFLESDEKIRFDRLDTLRKNARYAAPFMLDERDDNSKVLKRLLLSMREWGAIGQLWDYTRIFQRAFDYVISSTKSSQMPAFTFPDDDNKRDERRKIITEALATIAWINVKLRRAGRSEKFIFISTDTRILSICQYVDPEAILFSPDMLPDSFLDHYIRHPRCFLNDKGVLPSWDAHVDVGTPSEVVEVDIGHMYDNLVRNFAGNGAEPQDPDALRFELKEGRVVLRGDQQKRIDSYIEADPDLVQAEVAEFAEDLRSTLDRAAKLPSERTLGTLITKLDDLKDLSKEEAESIMNRIRKKKPDLAEEYEADWKSLMANSFDTFFFMRKLESIDKPSRSVANLRLRGAKSIQEFIVFTRELIDADARRSDDWALSSALSRYLDLLKKIRDSDPTLYSLALSHAYANATIGDWTTCISASRFAVSCIPTDNHQSGTLDLKNPNGREAYLYLSYAFRHTARTPHHFRNCRTLLVMAEDVSDREVPQNGETFDTVPERIELEHFSLSITEHLTNKYLPWEVSAEEPSYNVIDINEVAEKLNKLLNQIQGRSENVMVAEVARLRAACRDRALTNLLAITLEFEEISLDSRDIWKRFECHADSIADGSYFGSLVGAIGRLVHHEGTPNREHIRALRNLWDTYDDNLVFAYDRERFATLILCIDEEARRRAGITF